MNFLAGMMVYHASPQIAFCIFVKLLEKHDIKSNYLPGLPGLLEKCERIDQVIESKLPKVHSLVSSLVSHLLLGIFWHQSINSFDGTGNGNVWIDDSI